MSYAMALDNSWDVLSEEEMYDVNGGWFWKPSWCSNKWKKNAIGLSNTLVPMAMKAGYSGLIPWSDIARIGIAYNSYLSAFFGAGGSMTKITAFIGSILGPKGFIAGIVIGAVGSVFLIDQMGRRELFY